LEAPLKIAGMIWHLFRWYSWAICWFN